MKPSRCVVLLALVLAMPAWAQEPALPRSGDAVFDRTVELVLQNFYDPEGFDGFREAVRTAVAVRPFERDAAIEDVLASLGASHTGRFLPGSVDYYELLGIFRFSLRREMERLFPPEGEIGYAGVGMATQEIEGQLFVTDVYDGWPADRAGLEVGDELLSAPELEIGKQATLEVRREAAAAPIAIEVTPRRLQPSRVLIESITNSARVIEHEGLKLGYVRLWSLHSRNSVEALEHALVGETLGDADGLVLDLRGRWGGIALDAAEIFVGGAPSFSSIDRNGEESFGNVRWRRPLVALIDEGTRSALELFTYALDINEVPLIGERTAGALLAAGAFLLPDDSLLVLAVADTRVDGRRLEGVGIAPDVAVPFDSRYAAGRDPQLATALDRLAALVAGN